MGIMTLIAAFIIRKKTVDSFKELYRLYPELEGNLELLDTQAEFYDQDLKVILYKKPSHYLLQRDPSYRS